MNKILVLTGALLLLAVSIVACGTAPTAQPTTAPTTVPAAQPTAVPATVLATRPTTTPMSVPATSPPAASAAPATQATAAIPKALADSIKGGKLYDNWMAELGVEVPKAAPPLWATQSTNTRTGSDPWRCKECHGWDYKGLEGAYGSGSHRTGFKGILSASRMSAEEIRAWLDGARNANHNFSTYFTADNISQMVAFIQRGLVDTSAFIKSDKTVAGGDLAHGKTLFDGTCKACHGDDGKMLNFGDVASPEYLGTIAADNPWEFFHKASVGQPGTPLMPSPLGLGWAQQDIIDVLTYVRTLPTK